jgi:hypothetical protein
VARKRRRHWIGLSWWKRKPWRMSLQNPLEVGGICDLAPVPPPLNDFSLGKRRRLPWRQLLTISGRVERPPRCLCLIDRVELVDNARYRNMSRRIGGVAVAAEKHEAFTCSSTSDHHLPSDCLHFCPAVLAFIERPLGFYKRRQVEEISVLLIIQFLCGPPGATKCQQGGSIELPGTRLVRQYGILGRVALATYADT